MKTIITSKVRQYTAGLKTAIIAGILFLQLPAFSQQVAKSIPYAASPEGLIGFLEFRPTDYGTQKHPLIIFMHGIGERGAFPI